MITTKEFESRLTDVVSRFFGKKAIDCSRRQLYQGLAITVKDMLTENRIAFKKKRREQGVKQVYYMSMEFLMGKSLKNHLFNLGITNVVESVVKKLGTSLEEIAEIEPDAGLGNGGLGRLASAYMESLTNLDFVATGFSIKYEYGIFKQKIADGWQLELPDDWLSDGAVWLSNRDEDTFDVNFGGEIVEDWSEGKLKISYRNAQTVMAIPYDMNISGYHTGAVNKLRLWSARAKDDFDMQAFSRGDYVKAFETKALAESINKILYPADDHIEGKTLRLKQQYFFVSASIQSILTKHIKDYGTLDTLGEYVAIHINDTHPTLCIPELMRLLLDKYSYSWDKAWDIVCDTVSYTNHTVMAEALERWPEHLIKMLLPRVHQIIAEINKNYCNELWTKYPNDWNLVNENAIIANNTVRMANLCLSASHTINGVSSLHSDLLKTDVFKVYYNMNPSKFTNVTNGITYRRWLALSNPDLTSFITELIGDGFMSDSNELSKLMQYQGDKQVLDNIRAIKRSNKVKLSNYIKQNNNIDVNPDSIFDVQVKRLHEYKRQLLNCLNILDLYFQIKNNPSININPRTFIFGAKAAPSYYTAKSIIRLINMLGKLVNDDADVNGRIKVVFLENYRVSLAELIMPASDVSEQISVAGKEASGTGNMKFMINGAITIGTMDGANIEIFDNVGADNIFIFGLLAHEVDDLVRNGYSPSQYYNANERIKKVVDSLNNGIAGVKFSDLSHILTTSDTYLCLADFDSYVNKQAQLDKAYCDKDLWAKMSLANTAMSGFFSSDRSVLEYTNRIWNLNKVKL